MIKGWQGLAEKSRFLANFDASEVERFQVRRLYRPERLSSV
jgi:hypothetical protein